jgi:outer membrane protein OmpA-like peptidoglycan-associated protein
MKTLAALAVGAMALGLASAANAQTGWYLGVGGGAVLMQDPTTDITFPSPPRNITVTNFAGVQNSGAILLGDPQFKAKMDLGWAVDLSAGYSGLFIPQFRAEGEIAYRDNNVSKITESPAVAPCFSAGCPGTGDISSLAFMANGYYDFLNSSAFTPYIGGGVGAARVSLNSVGITAPVHASISADSWQFAYQAIAGVRYSFNPNWSLNLDYRYFSTLDPKFSGSFGGTHFSQTTQYHTHNIMLGLAYHFVPPPPPPPVAAAPPPPPPMAPPPAPAKQFVVYFEFDKSNLTPEGARVVSDAAAAFKAGGSAQVAIAGYTDLAGTQQYNIGLSKRRADTVRGALVKSGVPDGVIAESWHGKENPAVPTPDGVREPRNRRVEIML